MKRIQYIFLIILVIAGFNACTKKKKKEIIKQVTQKVVETKSKPKIQKPNEKIKPYSFTRGLYLTAYTVNSKKFKSIIEKAEKAGINTIVFDIKNMNGDVFFKKNKNIRYLNENHKRIVDIKKTVEFLHKHRMRAVARIVMFHDQFLAKKINELRPRSKKNGYWQESKRKKSWLDSSNPKVQNYLLNIIELVAASGVDEIQLDYIRFPTQGNQKDVIFYFQSKDHKLAMNDSTYIKRKREDIIVSFLQRVKNVCKKYNITLGGDVFAITAWQGKKDIAATGQNIKRMTKYLDSIHPMIYTSHFAKDFAYRKDAYNEPYYIVFQATKLTKRSTSKTCRVIPYIQANSWKVNYVPEYIYAQIQAVKDANAKGYILWNASNKYEKTLDWLIKKKM